MKMPVIISIICLLNGFYTYTSDLVEVAETPGYMNMNNARNPHESATSWLVTAKRIVQEKESDANLLAFAKVGKDFVMKNETSRIAQITSKIIGIKIDDNIKEALKIEEKTRRRFTRIAGHLNPKKYVPHDSLARELQTKKATPAKL